jgi:hypothetical protein
MASETRSRSAERALGLASQFNLIFAELSSAAKRPASLTVGVAGPFDPIEIADDVKAVHAALASKPDSVPVQEIERCLKIVTDMSAQRLVVMLEAIAAAMAVERDAQIAEKIAERDAAMIAQIKARDEEHAAKIAA